MSEPRAELRIRPARADEADPILALILPIQREEFGIDISAADQPDLFNLDPFYRQGAGQFWVAEIDGTILGTIALKDLGGGVGALRKMFVAAGWRGRDYGIATSLLDTLLAHASAHDLTTIVLGTTDRFLAAHRFYEKHGFEAIAAHDLPEAFPRMAVDTRFYRRLL